MAYIHRPDDGRNERIRCAEDAYGGDLPVVLVVPLTTARAAMRFAGTTLIQLTAKCDGMIDTTTASGELVFHIFSALAQFERRLIQERPRAGLSAARARGRMGGRKPIDPNEPRVQMAKTMHKDKSVSIADICTTLNISRATFYRYLTLEAKDANEWHL